MTKKKTKKRKFDPFFEFLRHPLSPFSHLTVVRFTAVLICLVCMGASALAVRVPAEAQNAGGLHAHDFVIFATVLNERGFALLGARARVRREAEKKFRWEATSDHQGELGIRVPQGSQYELTIQARGYKTQTRKIDAKESNRVDLTIKMEP
jgi:hypothetical protein